MLQIEFVKTSLDSWEKSKNIVNQRIKELTLSGNIVIDVTYIPNTGIFIIKYEH